MGRPRKVEVSESKQAVSTPVLRRSTRNKKVVEEVQDGDQGQQQNGRATPVQPSKMDQGERKALWESRTGQLYISLSLFP